MVDQAEQRSPMVETVARGHIVAESGQGGEHPRAAFALEQQAVAQGQGVAGADGSKALDHLGEYALDMRVLGSYLRSKAI